MTIIYDGPFQSDGHERGTGIYFFLIPVVSLALTIAVLNAPEWAPSLGVIVGVLAVVAGVAVLARIVRRHRWVKVGDVIAHTTTDGGIEPRSFAPTKAGQLVVRTQPTDMCLLWVRCDDDSSTCIPVTPQTLRRFPVQSVYRVRAYQMMR